MPTGAKAAASTESALSFTALTGSRKDHEDVFSAWIRSRRSADLVAVHDSVAGDNDNGNSGRAARAARRAAAARARAEWAAMGSGGWHVRRLMTPAARRLRRLAGQHGRQPAQRGGGLWTRSRPTTGTAERGQYLVDHVLVCGVCHTPSRQSGTQNMDMYLAGSRSYDFTDIDGTIVTVNAENLTTHDPEGLCTVDRRSDPHSGHQGRRRRALRDLSDHAVSGVLDAQADEDVDSIIQYLRTVPAERQRGGGRLPARRRQPAGAARRRDEGAAHHARQEPTPTTTRPNAGATSR